MRVSDTVGTNDGTFLITIMNNPPVLNTAMADFNLAAGAAATSATIDA